MSNNVLQKNDKSIIISTFPNTKYAQQEQKLPKIKDEKEYFCDIENLIKYIEGVYPSFFEQFEINDFINSGSQGFVYKGKYKKGLDNKKYAFKFCINKKREEKNKEKNEEKKEEKNVEKENKNQFQEISLSKKLHHQNINQILAFNKMGSDSYFSVLEYGQYGDLDNFRNKLLKRKILSETCINFFAKPILESLQYIHRCKIIHMDIKQGNILIDLDLNPKLIDFSASCSYSEFEPEDIVKFPFIGTGKYIAPEIIKKEHMKIKYSEEIDIYSFGITLYTLAFDIYPYKLSDIKGKQYDKILENVQNVKLEFPKDIKISEKFKDFLTKALEKDYRKRISIKEALNHPWIKGYQILYDEKQNIGNQENFLIKLITNSVPKFNEYMK